MVNKNKISRVILTLLMTLNINFVSPTSTNAKPVEDNYYNPYSHGVEVENKTFGANSESNSDRQAREKREAEARKQAQNQAQKQAEEAKNQAKRTNELSDAEKFAKFNQENNADNGKESFTQVRDPNDDNNAQNEVKRVAYSDESMKKYEDIAKEECENAAQYIVDSGNGVKIKDEIYKNVTEICNEQTIKDLSRCLAAKGNGYADPTKEDISSCLSGYVLQDKNISSDSTSIFDKIKNAFANKIADITGIPTIGNIIKSITLADIVEEVAITAGLAAATAATGGVAGVALVARLGAVARRLYKVKELASISHAGEVGLKGAKNAIKATFSKSPSTYGEFEKNFIKEVEKHANGKTFETLEDAQKFLKELPVSSKSGVDESIKGLKEVSKEIDKFKDNKFTEIGNTSINELEKTKVGGDSKVLTNIRDDIKKLEKENKDVQKKYVEEYEKMAKNETTDWGDSIKKAREVEGETNKYIKQYENKIEKEIEKATQTLKSDELKNLGAKDLNNKLQKATTNVVARNAWKAGIGENVVMSAYNNYKEKTAPISEETKQLLNESKSTIESIQKGYDNRNNYLTNEAVGNQLQKLDQQKNTTTSESDLNKRMDKIQEINRQEASIRSNFQNSNIEAQQGLKRISELNSDISNINSQLGNSVQSQEGRQNLENNLNSNKSMVENQYNQLKK